MKKSLGLFLVTILSMLLGFIRESIVAYKLGASWQADVFVFVTSLPVIIFSAIGGVLYTTILPLYTDARVKHGKEAANSFIGYVIKLVVLVSSILVLGGLFFPGVIVKVFAPGILQTVPIDVSPIVRIVLPSLIFLGLAYVFNGILNSYGDVIITSSIEIPMNIIIIIGLLFLYDIFGLKVTILSALAGSFAKLLLTYISAKKWGFAFEGPSNIGSAYLKKMMHLIIPMFISNMYVAIIQMISINIASGLGEGNIAIYNLANKLNNVCYSTAGNLIVVIVFPILAEFVAKKDYKNLSNIVTKSLNLSLLIMLPISILLFTFSYEAVEILFGYGRFNLEGIRRTSDIVKYFSVSLVFLGLKDILNRVFYSFKDRRVSLINTCLSIIIFVVFSFMLVPVMQIKALPIAMIVALITSVFLLFKSLKRVNISINTKYIKKNSISIFISAALLFFLSNILKVIYIDKIVGSKIHLLFILGILSLLLIIMYLFVLYVLNNDEIIILVSKLKDKINAKRRNL
ncbi:murein biosynthesis integral membrane protein MurJ [Clostridium swellfunianum]|uniref:murein biosynthesis integral membrane protein MurJ n=1 Tax=Clostridium swellfunianum TaxID=1367462 RepID=UPI00202F0336|nr:murein biosynthesis integral membrane protein MurJ [Clostridium swellfunianum]MCM0647414.1 murein biosynthesis integral membrane protein MurJ [Clostridium swellfunianum]